MKRILSFFRKELMLTFSLFAAIISLIIVPPTKALLNGIDWKTLATLFMLLSVLDGFKAYDLFRPVIRLAGRIRTRIGLSFFLVFAVFFSSMFVTNDVSLIIFVPLTMILFRAADQEKMIVPILVLENIAAVRGSLLTPFGSPQNLFLFGKSGMSAGEFVLMMLPLWGMSILLLSMFILLLHRREPLAAPTSLPEAPSGSGEKGQRGMRILYPALFLITVITIVSRTVLWPWVTLLVALTLLIFDRAVFRRVDYILLLTFLCFFVFSSSVAAHPGISGFLRSSVGGHEYLWSLLLSQAISNVPASIVLWPFTENLRALLYGLDTAGLLSVIGSLASVINLRLFLREYPGQGKRFLLLFEVICLAFFAIVVLPQYLLL